MDGHRKSLGHRMVPARRSEKWGKPRRLPGALSGRHSRGRLWILRNMRFTPKLLMRGLRGSDGGDHATELSLASRTPRPWTSMLKAGLLARGSQHSSCLPKAHRLSDVIKRMLTAHSCGGSSGLTSIMLADRIPILASNPCESEEPRTLYIVSSVKITSIASIASSHFRC